LKVEVCDYGALKYDYFVYLILMDPFIVDYSVGIPTSCSFVWAYKPEAANTV
jgi:hypothetical protein